MMMCPRRRIFKYELPLPGSGQFDLAIPLLNFLDVQVQKGKPVLWAEIVADSIAPPRTYSFRWVATGQDMPDENLAYVGTVQLEDGYLVLHLFRLVA